MDSSGSGGSLIGSAYFDVKINNQILKICFWRKRGNNYFIVIN